MFFKPFVILTTLFSAHAYASHLPYASRAVGEWASCSTISGLCIDTNRYTCSTSTRRGLCPGGSSIRCCPAPAGFTSVACTGRNGVCGRTTDCATTAISGLCPGPSGVTCCPSNGPLPTPSPTSDVSVRSGYYLEDNPPASRQYRARRRAVRPVIVLHTAESGGRAELPDGRAEGTANFIQGRGDFGSYHLVGDLDSIIPLVRFSNTAYHDGSGSNDWSIGISLAMRAADWSSLSAGTRNQMVSVMAQMAALASDWLDEQGVGRPAAVQLSKAQSELAGASGFIAHGTRDPARRSDPGADFPWDEFLTEYNRRV